MTTRTAATAHAENTALIARQLEELTRLAEESADVADPNWGHVGSAAHVAEGLAELIAFLTNREPSDLPARLRDAAATGCIIQ